MIECFEEKMPAALSIICTILCLGGGFFYGYYIFFMRKRRQTRGDVILNGFFILLLLLLGIALLFYYPFNNMGFLSTMILLVSLFSGVMLSRSFTSEESRKNIQYILAGLLLIITILKLFTSVSTPFMGRLPLNLCHINLFFILFRFLRKSRILDNYILCFGILGAVMNYIMGTWYDNAGIASLGWGFFNIEVFSAKISHDLILLYCVFMFTSREIIVEYKLALKNLLWIVPLYIAFIFFNQIFETAYFFTGIYANTPEFMRTIYHVMPLIFYTETGGFIFEYNFLHAIIFIAAAGFVLYIFSFFAELIQRRI